MAVPIMFQPLVKFADFNGRARRTEFWLWVLFKRLLNYGILAITNIILPPFDPTKIDSSDPYGVLNGYAPHYLPMVLIGLILFIPSLAVQVRRLHDSNRTGWWILLPVGGWFVAIAVFVGLVAKIAATNGANPMQAAEGMAIVGYLMLSLLPVLLSALLLFIFGVLDGTAGKNRFGPDPKGRGADASVF